MFKLYGVPFSAHTRKVILAANEKKIEFELVPTVPLDPPDGWRDLSPTGKIPVLADNGFNLADSSAICAYLEKKYPQPSIYPSEPQDFARALWLEEFVDGSLQQHILEGFLLETVFAPLFLKRETNWDIVKESLDVHIPRGFSYLESQTGGEGFLVGTRLSIADIALASILINFNYGGQKVDEARFPKLASWFRDILRHPTIRETLGREVEAVRQIQGMDTAFLNGIL